MADGPSSPNPPDGPTRATLRARSRTNPVRPEVIDALDELERSLGDVARWEQLLTGKETVPDWQRPEEAAEPRPRHLGPGHLAAAMTGEDEDLDDVVADLHEAIQSLDDRIEEIRPDARSITFDDPDTTRPTAAGLSLGQLPFERDVIDDLEIEPIEASPLLLQQARTVDPGRTRGSTAEQHEIDKRRRNGRMLTWTGLALLVGLGAFFLLPGEGDGDDAPTDTVATIPVTTPTSQLLPQVTFDPGAITTTLPTVPVDSTPTTAKSTTRTTARPTPTTAKPTATTVTQSSLPQPGQPTTPTTPTTAPVTTTTSNTPVTEAPVTDG